MGKFFHKQEFKASTEDCWKFISDPANLLRITPDNYRIRITKYDGKGIYPGQRIKLKLSIIPGIRVSWTTFIDVVKHNEEFTDVREGGLFKRWHHRHLIMKSENGCKLIDAIHYSLPFEPFSGILERIFIIPGLQRMFQYREKKLNALLNS